MGKNYLYIIIGLAIIFGVVLINLIKNLVIKKRFMAEYHIEQIPKRVKIRKNRKKLEYNYFELEYPYWAYANKDNTRDKRRKGNNIIWKNSILYLQKYKIKSKNPYILVTFVNIFRKLNPDIIIEKCIEEQSKYEKVLKRKEFEIKCNKIQNIIDKFEEQPTDFEEFAAELFKKMGYKAHTTAKTNDGGYDIELHKNGEKTIVECKCYSQSHTISRPLIQKLVGANQVQNADNMIFLTTSKFSTGAIEYAKETNVELIDGDNLIKLINKYFDIKNAKLTIDTLDWQLNKSDILKNIPIDIHQYV